MTDIASFYNIHAGETGLLVGNGENLCLTPPKRFDVPTIGMNTIHRYEGWRPTYYVAVDRRVMREYGDAIVRRFGDLPKFIPAPKLNRWQGPNFYRFHNRLGPLYARRDGQIWQSRIDTDELTYTNVMHVAIKLAYFMGFTTILIVGMQHKPDNAKMHFWGEDTGMTVTNANLPEIYEGYRQLAAGLQARGRSLVNISEDTYVPEEIIPRGNWRDYLAKEST